MTTMTAGRLPVMHQVSAGEVPAAMSAWAGLVAHAIVAAAVAASMLLEKPGFTLMLGGVSVFVLYSWLCWRESRRAPLFVSPLSFMFFWNSVGLGLSAIYIGSQAAAGEYLSFSFIQLPASDVAHGYVLYLIGILAMHAGIELLRPMPGDIPFGADLRFDKPLQTIACGLGLGLLYMFRQSWFSVLGGIAAPLGRMAVAAVCLLALLPHWHLRLRRHIHWALLAGATSLLVLGNIKSGSKAYIMFAFFPLVWAMIARKEMRKNLIYATVALAFLYTGLVAPTITYSRRQASPDKRTDYTVLWNAAEQASPIMSGSWDWSSFSRQFEHYLDRMFDASAVGFLVEDVSRNGFQNGDTMKYAAYAFIPRVLWPNKPNVSRGAWFSAYLGFSTSEEEATTSTGISAPGELYWNFGLPGILVGMLIVGLLFGQLWRMAGANPIHSPLHLLLYVCVVLGMPDLAEAVSVIAGSICLLIVFGSTFFLLQRPSY